MGKRAAWGLTLGMTLGLQGALAQSVTLYGIVDTAVRHSSNADGDGHRKLELVPSGLQASRWGLRGQEDLGGGHKAVFTLEGGIATDSGRLANENVGGHTVFGRQSFVGLTGDWGSLTFGRQYNALTVMGFRYDVIDTTYWWHPTLFGGDHFFMSTTFNNAIVYAREVDGWSVQLDHALGEREGSGKKGRSVGAGLAYAAGAWDVGGAVSRADASNGAVSATIANLGASFTMDKTRLAGGVMHSAVKGQFKQARSLAYGGVRHELTPTVALGAAYYRYRQNDCTGACGIVLSDSPENVTGGLGTYDVSGFSSGAASGHADMVVLLATYKLSARTTLYGQLDGTFARGGAAADQRLFWAGAEPQARRYDNVSTMVGISHRF